MSQTKTEGADAPETVDKEHGVLYLGIDLGTSRTSVCASNGVRETVESFVGYPKDPVARKLLKKDVLFGEEARQKRLSLNLHRPLAHGVLTFNAEGTEDSDALRAAQDLVKETVRLARPRKDELVYAVIGVPAQASIHNKDAILKAARESVDSVMLCSEPFSVAYGLDMLEDVLVIDIGAGTVDLCRMHGTMPEDNDQITLTSAGSISCATLAWRSFIFFTIWMVCCASGKASVRFSASLLSTQSPAYVMVIWSDSSGIVPCIRQRSVVPAPMSMTSTSSSMSRP